MGIHTNTMVLITKTALFPPRSKDQATLVKVRPALYHVLLTGVTGSRPDASMPENTEDQIRCAFNKIGSVLVEVGLANNAIVVVTTYYIGTHDHFDFFNEIRCKYVADPFPAWTAIEVPGLRRAETCWRNR